MKVINIFFFVNLFLSIIKCWETLYNRLRTQIYNEIQRSEIIVDYIMKLFKHAKIKLTYNNLKI